MIPIISVAGDNTKNIRGDLADALENTDAMEMKTFHDEVGHNIFLSLALDDDEEAQVTKIHRYFGHRSSRRVWELFTRANKLKGKKKAVFEIIV